MPAPFTSIVVNMQVRRYLGGNNPLTSSQKKCLSDTLAKMTDGSIKLRIVITPQKIRFVPIIACGHIIEWSEKNQGELSIDKIRHYP